MEAPWKSRGSLWKLMEVIVASVEVASMEALWKLAEAHRSFHRIFLVLLPWKQHSSFHELPRKREDFHGNDGLRLPWKYDHATSTELPSNFRQLSWKLFQCVTFMEVHPSKWRTTAYYMEARKLPWKLVGSISMELPWKSVRFRRLSFHGSWSTSINFHGSE